MAIIFAAAVLAASIEPPPDCPKNISICLQSARKGNVDLKTGIAEMDGDVLGYMKTQQLKFRADTLKAYRDSNNEWNRLVLGGNVRIDQPDTVATAGHSVLTREKAVLSGDGRVERPPYLIKGHEIEMDDPSRRVTAIGSPDNPARIEYRTAATAPGQDSTVSRQVLPSGAESGHPAAETILIQAVHAVVDSGRNEIVLTGQAIIDRPQLNWRMEARTAHLRFNDQRQLEGFRAEGGVKIYQPERTLRSDIALSRNNNETILLIGNAKVEQQGDFQVSSERLEVYTDANKGTVQGQDKPIKLDIDLTPKSQKKKPYRLDDTALQTLGGKGVPFETLTKLKGLQGQGYSDLEKFQAALRGILNETEVEQFMEAIVDHAN